MSNEQNSYKPSTLTGRAQEPQPVCEVTPYASAFTVLLIEIDRMQTRIDCLTQCMSAALVDSIPNNKNEVLNSPIRSASKIVLDLYKAAAKVGQMADALYELEQRIEL